MLCGLPVAMAVFDLAIGDDRWLALSSGADGDVLMAGSVALELEAPTQICPIAERTALNFLGLLRTASLFVILHYCNLAS